MGLRLFITTAVATCIAISAHSHVTLVKDARAKGSIFAADSTHLEAANLLSEFAERISGAKIPVTLSSKPKADTHDVIIRSAQNPSVKEDGFHITTSPGHLLIEGGPDKGSTYGVITLLERWLGCNYWAADALDITESPDIMLPEIELTENPAFRYRQSQNYGMAANPAYRLWLRLEEPADEFAGGYWVHTFNRLLPSAVYGESHPEYYAFFGGRRHPGKASQWCLSNPDVLEIVASKVDSIFRSDPGRNMISISQNDGNHTYCTCPECARTDSIEGAHSGSLIHFLNKLGARFHDKQFSTLAYLYTMHPPKHVKPLPNVNIMLCSIDCFREVPLDDNASGRDFLKALHGWAEITDNIFVWDYGINFDGTSTPFPNFHILQPNIRTFRDNHTTMHHSQIAGYRGGDMSEMRTYLVSKLMWNPDLDMDSLQTAFIDGYYGKAAPYIRKYITLLEGALLGSGTPLWLYDSPVTHSDGMLNPILRREYNRLFDRAEKAVADNPEMLTRVQRSRLPLQYSELEIARTNPDKDVADLKAKLDTFETRSLRLGLTALNERTNSPAEYCRLYRDRFLPKANTNLARDAKVSFSTPVPAPFDSIASTALTDGLFGGATFKDSWIGWEGIDASIVLDLGEEKQFTSVETDFLHQLGAWILLPKNVTYSAGTDGKSFALLGSYDVPEDNDVKVKFTGIRHQSETPVKARYIKVDITGTKQCPHWHYGVGNPCWFFLDEITVN